MSRYDAILLAGFGGPEGQDDVIPFLRNVTRGRGIPDERLEEVAHHYRHFGGISPINQQNRELKAALEAELAARGIDLPVYWGNRFWEPYFGEAIQAAHDAGHDRLLGLVTSAYTSWSGVEAYRGDLERALAETGLTDVVAIDRIREFFDHPGFVAPFSEGIRTALAELATEGFAPEDVHIVFATHSVPNTMAQASGPEYGEGGAYVAQHLAVAEHIRAEAAPASPWSLVYQSRSGDPRTPWLEPDINDAIAELAAGGRTKALVIVPLGFVSDHMEVMWDLDEEAVETAGEHGLAVRRVPTPGTHPAFVSGLVDLVVERLDAVPASERPHLTALGPWPDHARIGAGAPEADAASGASGDAPATAGTR